MPRSLCLASAAALVLSACATQPAPTPEEPAPLTLAEPEAEPAEPELAVALHEGDFAEIQQFTTPGGVSVWLVSEPSIPILALQMDWKAGSNADPEGLEGLADAVAYQMNEGAGDLPAVDFQRRMEDLNMSFGCSAGNDWTGCSARMLTENAGEAMDLIALAFAEPRFDEGPFERHRREDLISIKQRETNPRFLASEAIENALYPSHVYARDITEESVTARTREAALAHKDRLFTKDRLLVTAVGDISPEDLAPMIDEVFAGLPETSDLPDFEPVALPVPPSAPIVIALPQPQTLVQFIAPGLPRDHPDYYAATVLNYTLGGGGFESRLMKTLRVEQGLTYGIGTRLRGTSEYLHTWAGSGQTRNESAGEFVAGVKDILASLVETGVTEEELADAKAYLTGSYPLGFDSNAKIARNMMGVRQQALGVGYFDRRNAAIEAVTLEEVNRLAREYLSPDNFTFVLVGQPQDVGEMEMAAP